MIKIETLSALERIMLRNQFAILAKVDPGDAQHYEKLIEVLDSGWQSEYWRLTQMMGEEMSQDEGQFVWKTLALHDALQHSRTQLGTPASIPEDQVTFLGFDGNNEGEYLSLARFLLDRDERYSSLKRLPGHNSHMPMVPRYRARIAKWQELGGKAEMTEAEVLAILALR